MKKLLYFCLIVGILFWAMNNAMAGPLIFNPVIPSLFGGGNPGMEQVLLNEAQIQDPHEFLVKKSEPTPPKDPLDTFDQRTIDRIFSILSSKIADAVFGEEGLGTKHYTVGNYGVDINSGSEGIRVQITDNITLKSTTMEIPYLY